MIHAKYEKVKITVFADRGHVDLAGCRGTKAALKAAIDVQGSIYVPEHRVIVGRDADDIEQLGAPNRPGVSGRELLANICMLSIGLLAGIR